MINKMIEQVIKDISRQHKDIIVTFTKGAVADNVLVNMKYYNHTSFLEIPLAEIYRSSFPEDYFTKLIEDEIKKLKNS